MSQINWLDTGSDSWLVCLRNLEAPPTRAILGIGSFIATCIPQLFRRFLAWLRERCIYACKVAIRVARIVGLVVLWLLIVFGPLGIHHSIITGGWALLAAIGSWSGLRHRQVKTVGRSEREREGFYA